MIDFIFQFVVVLLAGPFWIFPFLSVPITIYLLARIIKKPTDVKKIIVLPEKSVPSLVISSILTGIQLTILVLILVSAYFAIGVSIPVFIRATNTATQITYYDETYGTQTIAKKYPKLAQQKTGWICYNGLADDLRVYDCSLPSYLVNQIFTLSYALLPFFYIVYGFILFAFFSIVSMAIYFFKYRK